MKCKQSCFQFVILLHFLLMNAVINVHLSLSVACSSILNYSDNFPLVLALATIYLPIISTQLTWTENLYEVKPSGA